MPRLYDHEALPACPTCGTIDDYAIFYVNETPDGQWVEVVCQECHVTVPVNDLYDAFLNPSLR
jgi:hypothetical protein